MSKDEGLSKAYLAGFIDGEGYIGITKIHVPGCRLGFKLRPEVEISGKFGDFLVEVKLKYGGCFMPHKRSGYGDYYPSLIFQRGQSIRLLKDVLPHLRIKKRQAEILIEFSNYARRDGNQNSDENLMHQIRLFNEIKKLNIKRGKRLELIKVKGIPPRKPS